MDSMWVTSAVLTWILMTASADSNSGEVITTKYGSFRGRQVPPPKDRMRAVNKYLGIPYAKPPVGNLRFRPPQEPEAWDKGKVRDFTKFGPACPQIVASGDTDLPSAVQTREAMRPFLQTMDEDCLYLNIYSPGTGHAAVLWQFFRAAHQILPHLSRPGYSRSPSPQFLRQTVSENVRKLQVLGHQK